MKLYQHALCCAVVLALSTGARATDLYRAQSFSPLASDRIAQEVGDLITIVVYENASASNTASSSSHKSTTLDGRIQAGNHFDQSGSFGLSGSNDNAGAVGRSGQMVAQISATVQEVLPNGDLRIAGDQEMNIGGEKTLIRIVGRVRKADISSGNAILSNRLADARIEYNGKGFASRGGKPGIVAKVFSWLGLL